MNWQLHFLTQSLKAAQQKGSPCLTYSSPIETNLDSPASSQLSVRPHELTHLEDNHPPTYKGLKIGSLS